MENNFSSAVPSLPKELQQKTKKTACDETQAAEDENIAVNDPFQMYCEEISRIPRLTQEQEAELFRQIAEGNAKAKQTVAEANLRLVVSIAGQYRNCSVPLPDLVQEGNLGLMKAVEKFDASLGFRFSTYAHPWIRKYILEALRSQGRTIVLSQAEQAEIKKIKNAAENLEKELGEPPTDELLAYVLHMPFGKVVETRFLIASGVLIPLSFPDENDPVF